jgi:hypothetical protein
VRDTGDIVLTASASNHLFSTVGSLKPFLIDLDEGFRMILDTAVIIGSLWIVGSIHGGWGGHDSSPPRKTGHLFWNVSSICQGEYLRKAGRQQHLGETIRTVERFVV